MITTGKDRFANKHTDVRLQDQEEKTKAVHRKSPNQQKLKELIVNYQKKKRGEGLLFPR